jgi:hypothetical protein
MVRSIALVARVALVAVVGGCAIGCDAAEPTKPLQSDRAGSSDDEVKSASAPKRPAASATAPASSSTPPPTGAASTAAAATSEPTKLPRAPTPVAPREGTFDCVASCIADDANASKYYQCVITGGCTAGTACDDRCWTDSCAGHEFACTDILSFCSARRDCDAAQAQTGAGAKRGGNDAVPAPNDPAPAGDPGVAGGG